MARNLPRTAPLAFVGGGGGWDPGVSRRCGRGLAAQPDQPGRGHPQRHLQLHPHRHARTKARICRRAGRGAGAGLRRSRPRRPISTASDTAHKLAILAALAFGHPVRFDAVHIEGIRHGQRARHRACRGAGLTASCWLGIARRNGNGVEARVHPCLVPLSAPIARGGRGVQRRGGGRGTRWGG